MPYRLIPDAVPRDDVVEALQTLLDGAKSGDITGIAFVCALRRMRYITNVAGSCVKNPTFTRGAVAFLSDELAGIVHRRSDDETR